MSSIEDNEIILAEAKRLQKMIECYLELIKIGKNVYGNGTLAKAYTQLVTTLMQSININIYLFL